MGGGIWDTSGYIHAAQARRAAGRDDFGYTSTMRHTPRNTWRAAPSLDAYGARVREARDSEEHPASTLIAVLFDVTGSMGSVPVTLQKRLPDLLGLLARGGYAQDPQILVGAIGDDQYDTVPLQVGQFESDNRIDDQLHDIFLEGGGGGDQCEGYALAAHFLKLEDPEAVCDLIALTIGIMEDAITLDEGLSDLADLGSTGGAAVGKALPTTGGRGARRQVATGGVLPADL